MKFIECHDIEGQLMREWEEDAREAWAAELMEALRETDIDTPLDPPVS